MLLECSTLPRPHLYNTDNNSTHFHRKCTMLNVLIKLQRLAHIKWLGMSVRTIIPLIKSWAAATIPAGQWEKLKLGKVNNSSKSKEGGIRETWI